MPSMIVAMAQAPAVIVLGQLDDDEERRDLGDVGQVAGDEDDRAVLADPAGEGEGEAGEHRRDQRRQHHPHQGVDAAAPRVAEASSISWSISAMSGCTVRTAKGRPMNTMAM